MCFIFIEYHCYIDDLLNRYSNFISAIYMHISWFLFIIHIVSLAYAASGIDFALHCSKENCHRFLHLCNFKSWFCL